MPRTETPVQETPPVVEPPPVIEAPSKTLGPTSSKSKFGDKFRAEFAKLSSEAPPKETPPPAEVPDQPTSKETDAVQTPVEPDKKDTDDAKTPSKPESPLDAVIEKGKPEEKPVETDVLAEFDKVEKPKSDDWKRARETMRRQSEQIKALETAPKTAPIDDTWQKKTQELEAALQERENTIKSLNAEYSQDYQQLVGKYQGTSEKIKTRMQSFGADGDSLLAALALPFSKVRTDQIDAVLAELPAGKQGRIESLIEELEGHGEKITEFRKDLPKRYEEMAAAQQAHAAEQQAQAIKQLEAEFGKISETLPQSSVTLRQVSEDVPDGTEWNKEIAEARETALRVLKPDGSDFNESASIALKGARYDSLEKRYLALHKDHSELKKSYAEATGSGPDFKGTPQPKTSPKRTPGQKFHAAIEQIRAGQLTDV